MAARDLEVGANIAGFLKVANAMMAQEQYKKAFYNITNAKKTEALWPLSFFSSNTYANAPSRANPERQR